MVVGLAGWLSVVVALPKKNPCFDNFLIFFLPTADAFFSRFFSRYLVLFLSLLLGGLFTDINCLGVLDSDTDWFLFTLFRDGWAGELKWEGGRSWLGKISERWMYRLRWDGVARNERETNERMRGFQGQGQCKLIGFLSSYGDYVWCNSIFQWLNYH